LDYLPHPIWFSFEQNFRMSSAERGIGCAPQLHLARHKLTDAADDDMAAPLT
jgi:hypothetical protein